MTEPPSASDGDIAFDEESTISSESTESNMVEQGEERADDEDDDNSPCQKNYIQHNQSKHVLFAMCLGLSADDGDDARLLSDFNVEPYASSKNKKLFKPKQTHLQAEVTRRVKERGLPELRSKNWLVDACRTWLSTAANRITNLEDIFFLREEEIKFYQSLVRAQQERATLQAVQPGGVVFTPTADLRMIHCLIEDDVKEFYLRRHEVLERDALDARSGPRRPIPHWRTCWRQ